MRTISARFADALNVSHRRETTITCTTPDGTVTELGFKAGQVSAANSTGVRYTARLTLDPIPGVNLYEIVATPGAVFDIDHGVNFGAGDIEYVDCGVYEAASGGVNLLAGDIDLTLVDRWERIERCRFVTPYQPSSAASRSSLVAAKVTEAIPDATINTTATGGAYSPASPKPLWDRDRIQFIADMERDGGLDCYFDAAGVFQIRAQPILAPGAAVWVFRTGDNSNIKTAQRERPFDRLYNTVVAVPQDESQTWARQTVSLSDPTHPRYSGKIGVVPYFYSSPTLTTAAAAKAAAITILQRVQGITETVTLDVASNPALEVGDVVTIAHAATETDPGFNATHIIDGFTLDLVTGGMSLQTRSSALADLEES